MSFAQKINLMPQKFKGIKDYKTYYAVIISIFLILGAVLIGFSLNFYEHSLLEHREKIDKEINSFDNGVNSGIDKKIGNFQKRLKNLSQILDSHVYWSGVFNFIEMNTLKKVRFENFRGGLSDGGGDITIEMDAFAPTFSEAARQIMVFRQLMVSVRASEEPAVKSVSAYDFKVSKEGEVSFSVSLLFKKDLLYEKE